MSSAWKPDDPFKELNEHLENAYKRVAGVVGFQMNVDRLNLDALSGSARKIVELNFSGTEPLFLRLGRSLEEAVGYRPQGDLSLKELAAEVLSEFHQEAVGAFQACRLRWFDEASTWLAARGMDEGRRRIILAAAEETFLPPSREEMTREALPLVKQGPTPGTLAMVGGFAGFGLAFLLFRHPLFAIIGAAAGAGLVYYLARNRLRTRARTLLTRLPQDLYRLLKRGLVTNQSRYQDIVNQDLGSRTTD